MTLFGVEFLLIAMFRFNPFLRALEGFGDNGWDETEFLRGFVGVDWDVVL